jgi:hypothetical protein
MQYKIYNTLFFLKKRFGKFVSRNEAKTATFFLKKKKQTNIHIFSSYYNFIQNLNKFVLCKELEKCQLLYEI